MGWYTTEGAFAGSEFTWAGKTMPAKNLVLYASWQAPSFTGIAHLTVYGTGGGTYDLGTIPYGGTISASALEAAQAEAELYKPHTTDTFGGWLIERNGSRTLFNASMQIYEDVVLYPQWISGVSYNVTYDLNGAARTAPVDATAYGAGAQAQVLAYDASVVPPTGMVFIGWLGSDGHIYYPGSAITITDNTTLTAQWSSSASAVTLTYNGNGGKRSDDSTAYDISTKNNTRHTVETNTFFNTGKKFVKWNTKADGSGTDYLEGASVLLSASQPSSPTTLYAIWAAKTNLVLTANGSTVNYNGSAPGQRVYRKHLRPDLWRNDYRGRQRHEPGAVYGDVCQYERPHHHPERHGCDRTGTTFRSLPARSRSTREFPISTK